MNEQANIQVVQQAYDHFRNGNIEGVLGSLASDVVWQTPQVPNVPHGGTYNGVSEVANFFASMNNTEDVQKFEIREFIAQGDRVVALGTYGAKVKATGRSYESNFVHIFTVRNGQMVAFDELFDTAVMSAAFLQAQSA
jgi:uncharacterized protein